MNTLLDVRRRDRGGVLVITLLLVVVLAAVVVAVAQFATVGLKTTDIATARTDSNADSANVVHWAIEEFAKQKLRPDSDCGEAPTYSTIVVPAGLVPNGSATQLECAQTNPINGEPVVHLIATSTGEQRRVIEATVEVARYTHGARIADWRVDIPINVQNYVTTTTTATTTTTVPGNTAPTANPTTWYLPTVASSTTFTVSLDASDIDGTIVNAAVMNGVPTPPPPGVTVVPVSGTTVAVTLDATVGAGVYDFTYTVTDDDSASAGSTIVLDVSVSPPTTTSTTTTTTLAPNLGCTFTVTNANGPGTSGTGQLLISNSGGAYSGAWQVEITQLSAAKPWSFTWSNPPLTASSTASIETVSGNDAVASGGSFSHSASLSQNGHPKINANTTLACSVVSP